jgi:hypothetical protein
VSVCGYLAATPQIETKPSQPRATTKGKEKGPTASSPTQGKDLGFTEAFEAEVKKIGEISPDEFTHRYPGKAHYLAKLTWDPTTAKYWDKFALNPSAPGAEIDARGQEAYNLLSQKNPSFHVDRQEINKLRAKKSALGAFDFRLNPPELALYKKNGFVVSERLGAHSFTDLYYRIYVRDLPVFVTSDSVLHAWHRYFDRLLENVETDYLSPTLDELLTGMAEQVPAAKKAYGTGPLAESLADVDFFLAVGRELLHPGSGLSALNQNDRVQAAVDACERERMERYNLFGRQRTIDFSQFKPRGRYDQHDWSKRYFRGMMWLGRIDLRIAGGESADQDLRELGAAVVLHDLLHRAKREKEWENFDRLLQHFVGRADSLNCTQLGKVLAAFKVDSAADVTPAVLNTLHGHIQSGKVAQQHIRGEWFCVDPLDPNKFVLPRTFAFLGQRFVLDSWVLSKVVYDDILWQNQKVQRRIPSNLEMSFAVLANDHVVPLLTRRMKDTDGQKFRDGLPYQHNLAAARNVVDRLPPTIWQDSTYAEWLGCLRELSQPTTSAKYPEAMRTPAWALKATTTQLASWTQLRHDTVLYAKPSYSAGDTCSYPAGFVEPVPHFWSRFEKMVKHTEALLEKVPFPDVKVGQYVSKGKDRKAPHLATIQRFAKVAGKLRSIAEKELAQKELSKEETKFLEEIVVRSNLCGAPPISGWYPELFTNRSQEQDRDDAHKWVALVTDVHTDPPSPPVADPGCVLHQAVGNVDLLVIAIDNGKDRMVYAGPVFSHYEFTTPNAVRRTNGDWQQQLRSGTQPARPAWTSGYLAPGVNPATKTFGQNGNP